MSWNYGRVSLNVLQKGDSDLRFSLVVMVSVKCGYDCSSCPSQDVINEASRRLKYAVIKYLPPACCGVLGTSFREVCRGLAA